MDPPALPPRRMIQGGSACPTKTNALEAHGAASHLNGIIHGGSFVRTNVGNRRLATETRKGVMWAAGIALLTASSFCVLVAGPLALYPGAQLDQQFERDHFSPPKTELKRYFTSDSFVKVVAYYKKLGLEAPGSTIDTKTRRRISFREKGDEKNVTTVEWSDEAGEDKSRTFILVNTAK
jgi:hypothetical protein